MKKLVSICLAAIAAFVLLVAPARAEGDVTAGAGIFSANCAACHAGGKNVVNPAKTLKKEDLEKYDMFSAEAIVTQVTNGKAAMPAFKGRLKPDQIDNVAAYVLSKAEAGW